MRTLLFLIILFIFLPWVELVILLHIARGLGWAEALTIVIATGVVGAALAKHQGGQALRRIREALRGGQLPARDIADGFLIFCAGLLLITPGLITDLAGFLLLIPPTRTAARKALLAYLKGRSGFTTTVAFRSSPRTRSPGQDDVIDVTATDVSEDNTHTP
jgi:UPF0716 protein FxsA